MQLHGSNWGRLALALREQGKHREAIAAYEHVIENQGPGLPYDGSNARYWIAANHAALGESDAAIAALEHMVFREAYLRRPPLFDDPNFESLRTDARFATIAGREDARLREAFHAACPDGEEMLKWGAPAFTRNGRTLAIMASFKAHAVLSFQRGEEIDFAALGLDARGGEAMGQLGRIESVETMPGPAALDALIRAAIALEEAGPRKHALRAKAPVAVPPIPEAFAAALATKPEARAHFDAFPPGAQRDYVDWIAKAKREATRDQRIATAIEWIAEGKKRHWKYEK